MRFVIGLVVLVCVAVLVSGYPRMSRQFRYGGVTPIAHDWLRAARAKDSLALMALSRSPDLVRRTLELSRRQPDLVAVAETTLTLVAGSRDADTVQVAYTIDRSACATDAVNGEDRRDRILFTLVRSQMETRVTWMALNLCKP